MAITMFSGELKKAVLQVISQLTIYEDSISYLEWDAPSARILQTLLHEHVITEEDLLISINALLKRIGRECFAQHIEGQYPDHTTSPNALAHALGCGEFTPIERTRIKYDHGETEEEFIRLYGQGVAENILSQLLSESDVYKQNPSSDT